MFVTLKRLMALTYALMPLVANSQVFVTQSGAGAQNGTDWANAYHAGQLRNAIGSASSGTQFWVASGVYKPAVTSRDSTFDIPSGVQVYGGFAGTETTLSQRDWVANVTILSGDVGLPNDSTDNSYHIVTFTAVDSTTTLDGFTITKALANNGSDGGGILNRIIAYNTHSAPHINNCRILSNVALQGGGLANTTTFSGLVKCFIDNCVFENNRATTTTNFRGGGAIMSEAHGVVFDQASLHINNTTFINNTSGHSGGGIFLKGTGGDEIVRLKGCTFTGNTAQFGAGFGMYTINWSPMATDADINIDSCFFTQNSASISGGGLSFQIYEAGTPVFNISRTTISNNFATNDGGGMLYYMYSDTYPSQSNLVVSNTSFLRNKTNGISGAFSYQTGFANCNDTTRFVNCLFYNNACSGGGYATTMGTQSATDAKGYVSLINSTIYNDSLTALTGISGGMLLNNAGYQGGLAPNTVMVFEMYNSILWFEGQLPGLGPKSIMNGWNQASMDGLTARIKNSLVRHSGGSTAWVPTHGINLGGNIDVYPQFADTNANSYDFRLKCISPALNAGDNNFIAPYTALADLAGENRIVQTTVDMGAYENPMLPPIAVPTANPNGLTVDFENSSVSVADSVSWDFGDGSFSSLNDPTHTYAIADTYTVCLYLFSACGDDDSCFTVITTPTGIYDVARATFTLAPNPAYGQVQVANMAPGSTITIYNMNGALVYKELADSQPKMVSTLEFSPGIYTVSVTDGKTGMRSLQKLLVVR